MGGGGVNCRQSARIQHLAFACDLAFSHMLHMPVSPPNSRFQAFSPQLTHLHRKKGEGGMLLHYTKQLGKFGFLHTCSPVTELLAKTPFYISSPGQLSNPPVTPPKILCGRGELFIVWTLQHKCLYNFNFILHKTAYSTVKIFNLSLLSFSSSC